MMKSIGLSLVALFLSLGSFAQGKIEKTFTYIGKNWENYEGHLLSIVVLDTSVGRTHLLAEQVIKDGKFAVSGNLAFPQNAYFGMYTPDGDFVYKQEFIAEPGKLTIDFEPADAGLAIEGGKYNALFAPIVHNPEYLAQQAELKTYQSGLGEGDFKDEAKMKTYNTLYKNAYATRFKLYTAVRLEHPDPVARLLAIVNSDPALKYDQQLDELEKELGSAPEITYLRYTAESSRRKKQEKVDIQLGTIIKDFSGQDLAGKTTHLTDVLKKNKYTLVEFWASWCGPCRGEIPHMKKAYEGFKNKGFEILSFTLDHERARWEKASNEENLPWINIGDLKAYKSPVVIQFGIAGIPANYLLDASGKVIAMNLRQEQLDEKLAELF